VGTTVELAPACPLPVDRFKNYNLISSELEEPRKFSFPIGREERYYIRKIINYSKVGRIRGFRYSDSRLRGEDVKIGF